MTNVRRKYALTKLGRGDYILPSNDGRVIWRIARYEDGPSHGIVEGMDRDRLFWGVWKWTGHGTAVDVEDWALWEMWLTGFDKRSEAIFEALNAG